MINLFMDIAIGYLDNPSKRLCHESFLSVCDLLVVLSRHLAVHLPSLRSLVYTADRDLELKLTGYLERRVFVEDEVGTVSLEGVICSLVRSYLRVDNRNVQN